MKLILFSGILKYPVRRDRTDIAYPVLSGLGTRGMLLSDFRVQKEGFYITTAEALLTMLINDNQWDNRLFWHSC